ncbi:hypothetical protein TNCV_3275511 [Trichonephila clavipes]|nr:hypothetical protein TNCV_3275511 [Trichonephila clavipes]
MNRDDSDLSSLSDDDDKAIMDDDEDQNVTFDFSAPSQQGIHTDKSSSFDFQETQYCKYTPPRLTENDEPLQNAELRLAFHIKELITKKLDTLLKRLRIRPIEVVVVVSNRIGAGKSTQSPFDLSA